MNLIKVMAALAVVLSASGCTTIAAPPILIAQAGFRPYVVRDDAQFAQVSSLPQDRLSIVQRHGQSYYLFPSPARDQLLVGRQREYDVYRRLIAQQLESGQQVAAVPLDTSGADWLGGWKTWGPFFPHGTPLEYRY